MDIIRTNSKGSHYVDVEEEFILDDTTRTRIVFKAAMHPGGIRGEIIRYRKDKNGVCDDLVPVNFNSLYPNEGIKITLTTDAIRLFREAIMKLGTVLEKKGIQNGKREYTVADSDALIISDKNKAEVIQKLLDAEYGEELWNQLVLDNPDLAKRLANSKIHDDRLKVLAIFEKMLADDSLKENDWQDFFELNTWIFGYGLKYQILRLVQAQPNYGGITIKGNGGQRGDFLTASEGETKYTCLVEIKKPTSNLLQVREYRNGAWGISHELAGAVSQIQVNCAQWEKEGSRSEQNREALNDIYTVAPRGIVVIGNSSELDCWDKKNSFERFRREIHNPEIVTYDELLERARYIVGDQEPRLSSDDELPF